MNDLVKNCTRGKFGLESSLARPGAPQCQLFLAQSCALNTADGACISYRPRDKFIPGVDVFGRNINQTQTEAFIRNTAQYKYFYASPNCQLVSAPVDPQDAVGYTPVYMWRNLYNPAEECNFILTLTPEQIGDVIAGQDKVMDTLINLRPRFDDILINIRQTMRAQDTWKLLQSTQFYQLYN